MSTLTVTSKGQVTLRKDILKHLGVKPGDRIVVELLPDKKINVQAARSGDISQIFGLLKNPAGPKLTIRQIKKLTELAWAGKR